MMDSRGTGALGRGSALRAGNVLAVWTKSLRYAIHRGQMWQRGVRMLAGWCGWWGHPLRKEIVSHVKKEKHVPCLLIKKS